MGEGSVDEAVWALWGKTDREGGSAAWQPLVCHLLDVAAVAEALLADHVSPALVQRFAARVGLSPADFCRWVVALVALHDFGKATPGFQAKSPEGRRRVLSAGLQFPRSVSDALHGVATAALLVEPLVALGHQRALALQASRWVAAHHGEFTGDGDADQFLEGTAGGDAGWDSARGLLAKSVFDVLAPKAPIPKVTSALPDVGLWLAGLTSVADWVGSMSEIFSYVSDQRPSLPLYLERARGLARQALLHTEWHRWQPGDARQFADLFGFTPRPLQCTVEALTATVTGPLLAVVEAPMGEGKTEAALWLAHELGRRAGHSGFYVALPTQATANQMHGRVRSFLAASYEGRLSLQLLHGGAALARHHLASVGEAGGGTVEATEWFSRQKRGFLAPFSVGTIDQSLLGVLQTRHFFVRLFGLSGKTVILDEVHAYDAYTSRLLDRMVAWLHELGASVVILSATLPARRRAELLQAWNDAPAPEAVAYPRVTSVCGGLARADGLPASSQREVQLEWLAGDLSGALAWLAPRIASGACAGWLCNTVARAQQAYAEAIAARDAGLLPGDTEVLLLHGRFVPAHRRAREERLAAALGKPGPHVQRPARMLVIGTQVLEQSLDVDFDVMVTDLAPVDLVLQRTGRLWRHERPRPAGITRPTLGLVRPERDEAERGPSLSPHAFVYDESVLLRSWLALRHRSSLTLPGDIEALVEIVYSGETVASGQAALDARIAEASTELAAQLLAEQNQAEVRLIEPPGAVDDPLAHTPGHLRDEDDAAVHASLRADTRLGDPSVAVVLLERREGQLFVLGGRRPIELESTPDLDTAQDLLDHALGLSARALRKSLLALSVPAGWRRSPFLKRHRALILERDSAHLGPTQVGYTVAVGFFVGTQSGGGDT